MKARAIRKGWGQGRQECLPHHLGSERWVGVRRPLASLRACPWHAKEGSRVRNRKRLRERLGNRSWRGIRGFRSLKRALQEIQNGPHPCLLPRAAGAVGRNAILGARGRRRKGFGARERVGLRRKLLASLRAWQCNPCEDLLAGRWVLGRQECLPRRDSGSWLFLGFGRRGGVDEED